VSAALEDRDRGSGDANGALMAEGSAAKDQVRQWYQDAQLVERAEQLPGVADRYRAPD